MQEPIIIIGEGWSAAAAVGVLGSKGMTVRWISGTGSRLLAPLPFLAASPGSEVCAKIAEMLGIETGECRKGSFLREFRNKGFREPAWTHAPTPGDREEVLKESLWEPEQRLVGLYEERFDISMMDLEEAMRTKILALPNVSRIEGAAVQEIQWENDSGILTLASGEKFSFQRLIFADRWDTLRDTRGLPKALNGSLAKFRPAEYDRRLRPFGAIQLVLHHDPIVGEQISEGFMLELTRETGDENSRHVFGGFFAGGRKSIWTVVLAPEELEDNHMIAKRLRRVKQALNKVFAGSEWIGTQKKEFMDTVTSETVRLEQSILFSAGDPELAPLTWEDSGITILGDGFGPSQSFRQVGQALLLAGAEAGAETQGESMNLADSSQS